MTFQPAIRRFALYTRGIVTAHRQLTKPAPIVRPANRPVALLRAEAVDMALRLELDAALWIATLYHLRTSHQIVPTQV